MQISEIVIENSFSLDSTAGENTYEMDIFGQTLWASRVFFSQPAPSDLRGGFVIMHSWANGAPAPSGVTE